MRYLLSLLSLLSNDILVTSSSSKWLPSFLSLNHTSGAFLQFHAVSTQHVSSVKADPPLCTNKGIIRSLQKHSNSYLQVNYKYISTYAFQLEKNIFKLLSKLWDIYVMDPNY